MRVLVEAVSSGLFYKNGNEWVRLKADARAFPSVQDAVHFCLGQRMPDVRLLVSFENPRHDFYVHPFGNGELADTTQKLLAKNAELQQQQWLMAAELQTDVGELSKTRGGLHVNDSDATDSGNPRCESAA